jgi:hypothetical protein
MVRNSTENGIRHAEIAKLLKIQKQLKVTESEVNEVTEEKATLKEQDELLECKKALEA